MLLIVEFKLNEMRHNCRSSKCHFFLWLCSPARAMASSSMRVLDRTQRRATVDRTDSSGRVISSSQRPLPDNTQHTQQTNIHAPGGIRTHIRNRRAAVDICLKVPIHVRVWLASLAGLGFQWVKLVRVWSVTSRTLADYVYKYIYIRAWLPSQAPRGGLASQTRTCMDTFKPRRHWDRL
jgi:hypothetical protein